MAVLSFGIVLLHSMPEEDALCVLFHMERAAQQ